MTNWARQLTVFAAQHGGDLFHPDVLRLGHQLWTSADTGRFILDGVRYTNIKTVAIHLHIAPHTLDKMLQEAGIDNAREYFGTLSISGHTLVFDPKAELFERPK